MGMGRSMGDGNGGGGASELEEGGSLGMRYGNG